MKAISLWQPWASWVIWGWKTVETRTHYRFQSLQGETIAIHASLTFDKLAEKAAWPFLSESKRVKLGGACFYPQGVIIGTARVHVVVPCSEDDAPFALIECKTPRVGLFLTDITEFVPPIPCKGRQGIFNVQL